MALRRASVMAAIDTPGEQELLHAWLDRWQSRLHACSDNTGCGCCVDSFEVVAPVQALAELPAHMRSDEADVSAD